MSKIITLFTMLGPLSAAKFWVAVIMGVVQAIQVYTGYDFGLDQQTVSTILAGITAFLVWLVPNKKSNQFPEPPSGGLY